MNVGRSRYNVCALTEVKGPRVEFSEIQNFCQSYNAGLKLYISEPLRIYQWNHHISIYIGNTLQNHYISKLLYIRKNIFRYHYYLVTVIVVVLKLESN